MVSPSPLPSTSFSNTGNDIGVSSGVDPASSLAQLGTRLYTSKSPFEQLFKSSDVLHSPLPSHADPTLTVFPLLSKQCGRVLGSNDEHSLVAMGTRHILSHVAYGRVSTGDSVGVFVIVSVGSSVFGTGALVGFFVGFFVGRFVSFIVGVAVGAVVGAHRSVGPVFLTATSAQFQYCNGNPSPDGGNGDGHLLIFSSKTSPHSGGNS
mmetsp:Transcript_9271/g.20919  ORF Transcript_9271/g.20919 Transcript_9271/m.20919 type:complete len:207 (+) Transcript_9271:1729-2349(+)